MKVVRNNSMARYGGRILIRTKCIRSNHSQKTVNGKRVGGWVRVK